MHLRSCLKRQGDLRVKVCSPLGGHKQGDTGMASKSGNGTSLCTLGDWKSDNLVASLCCGEPSQELMGELKSVLGHRKVLSHSMLLLVRCAEAIWFIR